MLYGIVDTVDVCCIFKVAVKAERYTISLGIDRLEILDIACSNMPRVTSVYFHVAAKVRSLGDTYP